MTLFLNKVNPRETFHPKENNLPQKSWLTMSSRETAKPKNMSSWAQPSFKQTVLFRAIPVLFRTKKSDKVNDQHCLSFAYLHTSTYLHTQFSLLGKFGEVIFFEQKFLIIRYNQSFKEILIERAYFLVKNGSSYKGINMVISKLAEEKN